MKFLQLLLFTISIWSLLMTALLFFSSTAIFCSYNLLNINSISLSMNTTFDWMNFLFASTILFITTMIVLFSKTYINPSNHYRFFAVMTLFMLSMLILIMSNNMFTLMLGWDGLGLTSYALVIFYQNSLASSSGTLTILSNRLGDISIIVAIATSLMISTWNMNMQPLYPKISIILLLIAALSKSAQFPFSAWLPAAMAAPTPISALVHSSTLVTAGVFLILRLSLSFSPLMSSVLLYLSVTTLFLASLTASWEQDLKKIIALSTLSQIAMMMMALAMNLPHLAFFHLITHALFKSCMFLCAGTIIFNSTYQDMRFMNNSMNTTPILNMTFGISTLALMGIPFTSGFYSKDSIMEMSLFSNTNFLLMCISLMSLGLTTCYSTRMIYFTQTFLTKSKPDNMNSTSLNFTHSLLPMSLFALLSGCMLSWFCMPHQMTILTWNQKSLIFLNMLLGMMTGLIINFKNKNFNKLGNMIYPLWFLNTISFKSFSPMLKFSSYLNLTDKTWNEKSSGQGMFLLTKNTSPWTNKFNTQILFLPMLFFMIPSLLLF